MGGGPQHPSASAGSIRTPAIEMQHAENWVLRHELVSLSREAIARGLSETGLSLGNNPAGFPAGLDAFADVLNRQFRAHIPVVPDRHLVTGPGAGGCLMSAIPLLCKPGDEVLIPRPYWNGFDAACTLAHLVPVGVQISEDLHASADGDLLLSALERAIVSRQGKVRALLVANPGNPIGRRFSRQTVARLLQFCQMHGLHLISDEVYALTRFRAPELNGNHSPDFHSVLSFDLAALGVDAARVHAVWSMSKTLGLSALRYLETDISKGVFVSQGNPGVIGQMSACLNQCTSVLSCLVASHILCSPELPQLLELNSQRLQARYQLLTGFFRKHGIEYVPCNAAPYLCARIAPNAATWEEEEAAVARLAEAGVNVFGLQRWHPPEGQKGWARFNFAIPYEDLTGALARMEAIYCA